MSPDSTMLAATIAIAVATVVTAAFAGLQLRVYRQQLAVYRQQAGLSRRNLKVALYEKRLAIYQALMKFLASVRDEGNAKNTNLYQLLEETSEVDFLFPPEIRQYLREAYVKGLGLKISRRKLSGEGLPVDSPEREHQEELDGAFVDWFSQEITGAFERFRPYLDFTDL
jgi:hypothetical protein